MKKFEYLNALAVENKQQAGANLSYKLRVPVPVAAQSNE
jgi:hypothetical protein